MHPSLRHPSPEVGTYAGILECGQGLPVRERKLEHLRGHASILGRIKRAARVTHDGVKAAHQCKRNVPLFEKSKVSVAPGRGNESSPGDGRAPKVFMTARNEACPDLDISMRSTRTASFAFSG